MKYHLIAIGGTGMGALAGLLKAAGHEVRGSDRALYPPMSDQLKTLQIPVFEGFSAENLAWGPDVVVVGNVCTKDHVEVLEAQRLDLTMTSLPATLSDAFLTGKHPLVVAGTHGKTTTSSLLAHIMIEADRDPGVFVGGVPVTLGRGWRAGAGEDFIVEGDEYDSAFFDKESKFLHYQPRTAILTSVELDHVDIFSSMDAVRDTFRKFVALIPEDGLLVVSAQSSEAMAIADSTAACRVETYRVTNGEDAAGAEDEGEPEATATWTAGKLEYTKHGRCRFDLSRGGELFDSFESLLVGRHNVANVVAAVVAANARGVERDVIRRAVGTFAGVRRRQEIRGVAHGVTVIDDYAHHPTAVRETLRAMRRRFAKRRIVAVFEPRSATSRRKTFQREYAGAFAHADVVILGRLYDPSRIPDEERFDPEKLTLDLRQRGTDASYIESIDDIVARANDLTHPGDVVVVFSSGSFDGLHDKLLSALGDPVMPARPQDMADVRAIATEVGLETTALGDEVAHNFYVLRNETGFVGCVGLEVYGDDAVLRSLAVNENARGVGYGWLLADTAIAMARHRGVRRVYLLTEHASDFFAAKLGFRIVDPSTVGPAVAASTIFEMQRDRETVAMRLDL